jgi:hypothetical protein
MTQGKRGAFAEGILALGHKRAVAFMCRSSFLCIRGSNPIGASMKRTV